VVEAGNGRADKTLLTACALLKELFTLTITTRYRGEIPEFGSPFSGLALDRKLTEPELVRAIRFMVAAKYEAIKLYMQLVESTNNDLAQKVLKDIAYEERVHAGNFLRLLYHSRRTRKSCTKRDSRK